MARYPISKEGITAYEQLKKDLQDCCSGIESEGAKLRSAVKGSEEDLGYLYKYIEEILNIIEKFERNNSENIQVVNKLIDERIQKINDFLKDTLL